MPAAESTTTYRSTTGNRHQTGAKLQHGGRLMKGARHHPVDEIDGGNAARARPLFGPAPASRSGQDKHTSES
jgi:hypothetical protein